MPGFARECTDVSHYVRHDWLELALRVSRGSVGEPQPISNHGQCLSHSNLRSGLSARLDRQGAVRQADCRHSIPVILDGLQEN
jgi:hypothetical protein